MKLFRYLPLFVFAILACFSLIYIVTKTLNPSGATDFHSYWYAGQFIRQGTDPYNAFINNQVPKIPITYLDGQVAQNLAIAQPGLARIPANTAPIVELLTIFSLFSWSTAKTLWMACNLALILAIPFLVLRLFPALYLRPATDKLLFIFIFIGLFGTRNIAGNGQTSLFVFAAMLLAILAEHHWLYAGIDLGFALSKYSLALPLLILFLIERKYRQIIIGLAIQFVAIFTLSAMTRQSIVSILDAYVRIFQLHTDLPGIHLATLFPAGSLAGCVAVISLSLATIGSLGYWLHTRKMQSLTASHQLVRQTMFTILMMWTLLVAYHRAYDTFVTILLIALIAEWLIQTDGSYAWQRWSLAALAGLTIIVMTLPARGISIIEQVTSTGFMAVWLRLQSSSITLLLLAILACSIWILYQFEPAR
jgi:hypothetical protein